MTWTTKATIKTLQGISDTSLDDVIDLLIPQAEAMVKSYLHREIEQATYTEYYSGTGNQILVLNQSPVQSITSIHEDCDGYYGDGTDAFSASTALSEGTDFVLQKDDVTATEVSRNGIVYRIGQAWPRPDTTRRSQLVSAPGSGLGNIKVIYVAGWATVPGDIQFATNKLITSMLETRNQAGRLASESIEDYSYKLTGTEDEAQILNSVKSALARYKRVII